jgi:hypothetical protein
MGNRGGRKGERDRTGLGRGAYRGRPCQRRRGREHRAPSPASPASPLAEIPSTPARMPQTSFHKRARTSTAAGHATKCAVLNAQRADMNHNTSKRRPRRRPRSKPCREAVQSSSSSSRGVGTALQHRLSTVLATLVKKRRHTHTRAHCCRPWCLIELRVRVRYIGE